MQLIDVVAIVTGGSSGLGKAFATRICESGGKVLIADLNTKAGENVCNDLNSKRNNSAIFVTFDVCEMNKFENLFITCEKAFQKPVNLIINNAGIAENTMDFYGEQRSLAWTRVVDINLTAVIRGTQIGIQHMIKSGQGGLILNISSTAGLEPIDVFPVYSASKWGVVGFTASTAKMASEKMNNIRINAICPGLTDTPLARGAIAGVPQSLQDEFLKDIMSPSLIAEAMVELIKDESKNGQALCVLSTGSEYVNQSKI